MKNNEVLILLVILVVRPELVDNAYLLLKFLKSYSKYLMNNNFLSSDWVSQPN